jgi:ATP-binding protein involved in chromosome partitioning
MSKVNMFSVVAHQVQSGLTPLPNIKNIIAIASGKGGVGKSTTAVNLALALVQQGARVGVLDADMYGPSIPLLLDLVGQEPQTPDGKTILPLEQYGLQVMSIGFLIAADRPAIWRGPMVTKALQQMLFDTAWDKLDYLIVDLPPGTGDIQLTMAQKIPVAGAVIVTTPQELSLIDARKALTMFKKVNVKILGVIENMSTHQCSHCGHNEAIFGTDGGLHMAQEFEAPLLAQLPLEQRIREQSDLGKPIVIAEPDSAMAKAYLAAAKSLAEQLALQPKDYSAKFGKIAVEGA